MIVYLLTNAVNGKVYIGKTTQTWKQRWRCHVKAAKNGDTCYICKAIRKYGAEAFAMTVLADGITDEKTLDATEIEMIARHGSFNPDRGYNMSTGGEGATGVKRTPEQIEFRRQLMKSQNLSGERNPFFGKKHSEETKALMSENHPRRGKKADPEEVRRRADSLIRNGSNKGPKHHLYGKQTSPEAKQKLRECNLGERNAMWGMRGPLAPAYGRKCPEDVKQKMREAKLGRPRDPETVEKIRNAWTPEKRAHLGDRIKEAWVRRRAAQKAHLNENENALLFR